jgi:hypothetical protein
VSLDHAFTDQLAQIVSGDSRLDIRLAARV